MRSKYFTSNYKYAFAYPRNLLQHVHFVYSADSGISNKSDSGLLSFVPLLKKAKSKAFSFLDRSIPVQNDQKPRALVVDGKTLT